MDCAHERFTETRVCTLTRDARRGTPIYTVTCSDCGKNVDDFTEYERKAALHLLRQRAN